MKEMEYERPDAGTLGTWADADPEHHGFMYVAPGRRVMRIPGTEWQATPEKCTAGPFATTWHLNDTVLLCNGCGLDCT
ncbi:hypothetical protein ACTD5D_40395 [Nocardia takedensis]|uniref:hypothetical protein n=1 Tax=Nocardia takedensis TaxID=259390 RepID=UPI003F765C76